MTMKKMKTKIMMKKLTTMNKVMNSKLIKNKCTLRLTSYHHFFVLVMSNVARARFAARFATRFADLDRASFATRFVPAALTRFESSQVLRYSNNNHNVINAFVKNALAFDAIVDM